MTCLRCWKDAPFLTSGHDDFASHRLANAYAYVGAECSTPLAEKIGTQSVDTEEQLKFPACCSDLRLGATKTDNCG